MKIVLCEAHPDPIAKLLILDNMSFLMSLGCSEFGIEHDADKTIDFELQSLQAFAQDHRYFLDNQTKINTTPDIAWAAANSEGNFALLKLLSRLQPLVKEGKLSYRGLDVTLGNRFTQSKKELNQKLALIPSIERDRKIAQSLLQAKSGIFIIGASHMTSVQKLLIAELGITKARQQFLFIIPFKIMFEPEIDARHALYLAYIRERQSFMNNHCPLGNLLFLNENPPENQPLETINYRFQQYILQQLGRPLLPAPTEPSVLSKIYSFFRQCCPLSSVDEEYVSYKKTM